MHSRVIVHVHEYYLSLFVCVFSELEKKLKSRADRDHLVQKNILPGEQTFPHSFHIILVDESETHYLCVVYMHTSAK